jgi:hypothetical protein
LPSALLLKIFSITKPTTLALQLPHKIMHLNREEEEESFEEYSDEIDNTSEKGYMREGVKKNHSK